MRGGADFESGAAARLARLTGASESAAGGPALGGWVPDQPAAAVESPSPSVSGAADGWLHRLEDIRATAGGQALLWLGAVCALCVVVTAWTLLHHRASAVPQDPPSYSTSGATAVVAVPTPTPSMIVVDVGGRVRHPGLQSLPLGARVADAIRAAGGALRPRDIATLNLAARLTDGQLLLVGVTSVPMTGTGSDGATGPSAPVDLNAATVDQLESLPGIGPVLAQRILDWRTAHGAFGSVDELNDVSGIGDSIFAELKPLVTV